MKFLNRIHFQNLRGDLFGGVTTAIISLPLALAFGVASGAGAEAGLYGAVIVGLFAALFGGTPTLISEPTGPMTVIMTAIVTSLIAANPENGMAMAFTVVMIAGAFQIVLGMLRLGKYVTLMPYSVISGFMSGIGVILVILQIAPFLGEPSPPGGVLGTLQGLPELIGKIDPFELGLGVMTLAILFLMPRKLKRYVPPQLAALVIGTVVSVLFLSSLDIRRIGEIPMGLPDLVLPYFTPEQITTMVIDGLVLGILGCIDSLLTSMISDSLTRSEHDSNKELVGQGIGNIVSGFFGGLPGAGATMGTVVNIQTGATTALSGITRALILLVVVLGASQLTQSIPLAVLAGIALHVGINILDWSFLKRVNRVSWQTGLVMFGVMLLTVFVDLIVAVGVGVFVANIMTIERLSALQSQNLRVISDADDTTPMSDEERRLLDRANGRVLLFYLSGPMIFGVSKAISRQHAAIRATAASNAYDAIIIDLSDVPLLDVTVALAIENAIKDSVDSGREVLVVLPPAQSKEEVTPLDVSALLPPGHVLDNRTEALRRAVALVEPGAALRVDSTEETVGVSPA